MQGIPRRVFLSHTSEFREWPAGASFVAAAESAVTRSGNATTDMQYFTAGPDATADVCRRRVLESDVYVGLVGFRYGSPVQDLPEVSYTELEFAAAADAQIPRLVFLLHEDAPVPYRLMHDGEFAARQEIFRERLTNSNAIVAWFSSPDELEIKVLQALYELPARDARARRTAAPWMAPRMDGKVVARPEVTAKIAGALMGQARYPIGIATALTGAGGFGKTTLATLVTGQREIRDRFPGGLLWVTVGQVVGGAELAAKVNDLAEILSGRRPTLSDPVAAGHHLGDLLSDRADTLLVIDDVWESAQLLPFMQGGEGCTRLITTRMQGVLPDDSIRVHVDEMRHHEASALLTQGLPELDREMADRLLRLTGRWPVLLALVNSAIRRLIGRGASVEHASALIYERLRAEGPAAVDVHHGGQRAKAVAATVEASLELLSTQELDRYLDLAIFAEDAEIPVIVLSALWPDAISANQLTKVNHFCEDLAGLSLLSYYRPAPPVVRLHDVIRSYLRSRLGTVGLAARNRRLLEAVAGLTEWRNGVDELVPWWTLPDGTDYLWQHLPAHLADAGRGDELTRLVTDLRWIAAKLELFGPVPIEADLNLTGDPLAVELRAALSGAAHLLDPVGPTHGAVDTLLSQLDDVPTLKDALATYRARLNRPWLSTRWRRTKEEEVVHGSTTGEDGRVNAYSVSPDGAWLAIVSDDRKVRIVETTTWTEVRVLEGHTQWVVASAVAPDGSYSAGGEGWW